MVSINLVIISPSSFLSYVFRVRVVVHAKSLQNPIHVIRFRLVLIITIAVLLPVYIVLQVVYSFMIDAFAVFLVALGTHIIEMILLLGILGTLSFASISTPCKS